ncbi:hypothetical protein DEMA109039_08715 [Deinococcus marmoris]
MSCRKSVFLATPVSPSQLFEFILPGKNLLRHAALKMAVLDPLPWMQKPTLLFLKLLPRELLLSFAI